MGTDAKPRQPILWIGFLLGLGALAVYLVTLSRGAFPGLSARLIVQYGGLEPNTSSAYPLWGWCVWALAHLTGGSLAQRLNLFSALCAAVDVVLFYRVVALAIYRAIDVNETNAARAAQAAVVGGIAAVLFLAFCLPFWIVATRAHMASFDLLLLLVLASLFVSLVEEFSLWRACALALLYGVVTVEFATLIVLGPLALAGMLVVLWKHEELVWHRIALLALCALVGLGFYALSAWRYMGWEAYALKGYTGFGQVLVSIWRDQYMLIAHSLPHVGWLLVVLVGIVPWLVVLSVARRALNEEMDWGFYLLHTVITGLVAAVLFNVRFAPWSILGTNWLLVTPYVLLAACFGYLTAYWFLLPCSWWREAEEGVQVWLRAWLGRFLVILALGAAVAAAWLNLSVADGRPAATINAVAGEIVGSLEGREWLVTDGLLDDNLLIAAQELRVPLRLINLQLGNNPVYMKYVARAFPNPRLQSLAEVGLLPMLREWLEVEPQIDRKLALQVLPDLWVAGALQPVPNKLVFLGRRAEAPLDADQLWRTHAAFWQGPSVANLRRLRQSRGLLTPLAAYWLRQMSLVANNLGVLMEDLGRKPDAFAAYAEARQLDEGNVSALLNQRAMVDAGFATNEAAAVHADFDRITKNLKERYHIWSLSRYYGYVRAPEAFVALGLTWTLSGYPGAAVAGLKKAIDLAPERAEGLNQMLASVYMKQGQSAESEAVYRALLDKVSTNGEAQVGMARLAARRNNFTEAADWLAKAEKSGIPKERTALEWALMHAAAGRLDQARIALQELVEVKPDLAQAWVLLAAVMLGQGDLKGIEACERELSRMPQEDFLVAAVEGQIAMQKGDLANARKDLYLALNQRPSSVPVLEMLLQIDQREARSDLAEQHVRQLLSVAPDNSLGNYVLGSLQTRRREYALAENSLRKSLARNRAFETLNDLAVVLQERGSLDEAEALAREALKTNATVYAVWDTLGVILVRKSQWAEAEEDLRKAMAMYPDDLSVQVHLVQLYAARGDRAKALELADQLLSRGSELNLEDRETLHRLRGEAVR